jgi:cellulose synthase operon protein C
MLWTRLVKLAQQAAASPRAVQKASGVPGGHACFTGLVEIVGSIDGEAQPRRIISHAVRKGGAISAQQAAKPPVSPNVEIPEKVDAPQCSRRSRKSPPQSWYVIWTISALWITLLVAAGISSTGTPGTCEALRKHGHRAEAQRCFEGLTKFRNPYLRAEGYWGLGRYEDANDEFRTAVAQSGTNAYYRVRWGRLLHERFNNRAAEDLFREALRLDNRSAQAYLGLALVSADGFDGKAIEWTAKALELDPKLVEAHELMSNLALEDSDTQQAIQQADQAIKLSPDALDAMAVRAAVEVLADQSPDAWLSKIRQVNPSYGQAWAIVAHHLELNYRYEDAVAYYRKAVEIDPQLWSARSELGINLMRLGQDQQARQQLELCYDHDYRDAATVNSLRLLDSYSDFVTIKIMPQSRAGLKAGSTSAVAPEAEALLKLHKKEAGLLRPYFEAEMRRDIADYEKKYQMKLPGPVQVEVYPDYDDFAVRATGMPGLDALGVTFGEVVAMDSPSASEPGSFSWASALRHEMSHVFILTATNNRVPRWFTEGLAVHEESEDFAGWGERLTPDVLMAVRDRKLLPVMELDQGFVRPAYPGQVLVSYFQAGQICDFIESRWGDRRLLDMVHSFAQHSNTAEVIRQDLGMTPGEFDRRFEGWLNQRIGRTAANLAEWRKHMAILAQLARIGAYDEVLKEGDEVRRMYPQYVGSGNVYEFLAEAEIAKRNQKAAVATLTEYEKMGGLSPDLLKELASIDEKLGETQEAAAVLDRINYIYPVDEDLHRRLGGLWFAEGNYDGAIREYGAVAAMRPLDVASSQFYLARAYFAAGRKNEAQEHLLTSLESAPDYRPAQKLLLEIEDSGNGGKRKAVGSKQ